MTTQMLRRRPELTAILLAAFIAIACEDPNAPSPTEEQKEKQTVPVELAALRILFETPAGLRAMKGDGSEDQLLVLGEGLHSPDLSRDGTRLAYTVAHGDSSDLWVADANGRNRVRIREGHIRDPRWSGDGQKILFTDPGGVHVTSPDGTTTSTLIGQFEPYHDPRWPSWSPDDSRIAFGMRSNYTDFPVVNVKPIDDGGFLFWGAHPTWSSTGRLAYMSGPYGPPELPHVLQIMDPDEPLIPADTAVSTPAGEPAEPMDWSSDGAWLLYTRRDSSGDTDLYVVQVDDGTIVRLTRGGTGGPGVFFPD